MFISFMIKAALISLSGVLSPGPITAVTVSKGTEHPLSGFYISIGHLIVELPLMILIVVGLDKYLQINWVRITIGILGGLFLMKMGLGLLKNIFSTQIGHNNFNYTPIQAGMILSISNPYFLIWWSTVGAMLLSGAYQFGLLGVIIFMFVHLSCDFLWYIFLSSLTFKGGQFFGQRLQQVLFAVCGLFLLFFSGKFLYDAINIVL
jgi:threonine/homoserine/homoserine lactone efflux protein